eukprot:4151092-Lingulodinium_polyedra.AAC.1
MRVCCIGPYEHQSPRSALALQRASFRQLFAKGREQKGINNAQETHAHAQQPQSNAFFLPG